MMVSKFQPSQPVRIEIIKSMFADFNLNAVQLVAVIVCDGSMQAHTEQVAATSLSLSVSYFSLAVAMLYEWG